MAFPFITLPATATKIGGDPVTTFEGSADAGGAYSQMAKIGWGAQGVYNNVSAAFPLPTYGPDVATTGTITTTDAVVAAPAGAGAFVSGASTAGSFVALACGGGDSSWNVQITGLTSGTLYFEGSLDSTTGTDGNWIALNARQTGIVNTVLGNSSTTNGMYRGNTSGLLWFRLRSVGALSGTPAIRIRISEGVGATFLNASVPPGTNNIGTINIAASQTIGLVAGAAIIGSLAANQSVNVAQINGVTPLMGNGVTGTGSQRVTIASDNTAFPVNATLSAETTKVIGTVNLSAAQTLATVTTVAAVTAITNALPVGANKIGTVDIATAPATAKGTQSANGIPTQALKDSGRVGVAITCYQAAGIITTEALFAAATFSSTRDGAAATTGQQFTVTAGKRFSIQSLEVSIKNTAAAAGTSKLALRYLGAGGTISNTSPIQAIWDIGSNNATANNYIGPTTLALPDGMELIGGGTFGFTNLSSAATMLHTISVNGYEY